MEFGQEVCWGERNSTAKIVSVLCRGKRVRKGYLHEHDEEGERLVLGGGGGGVCERGRMAPRKDSEFAMHRDRGKGGVFHGYDKHGGDNVWGGGLVSGGGGRIAQERYCKYAMHRLGEGIIHLGRCLCIGSREL